MIGYQVSILRDAAKSPLLRMTIEQDAIRVETRPRSTAMNFMNVDYSTKIPNNVNLSEDRQVLKALEGWHPGYMDWWGDMGPEGFQQSLVYLRTAYSVDPRGWAKFDYVKMPEYRWGILLAPQEENRVIPFGENYGKMQLHSLAQSGFDPLSRTCRFMLTEEAHHMFVGETGISRVVQRTCEAMKEAGITDPTDVAKVRALGVIDLPTIQKKLNLHYSLSLDLFGSEVSTNAANAFTAGIKGRYKETQIDDDHQLKNAIYPVLKFVDGEIKRVDEPALTALNMRLRDDYTQDCAKGMLRWNKIIQLAGYQFKLTLPNVAFHRQIGEFKDINATPDGVLIDDATWSKRKADWLPSTADGDFIASLMTPVTETGKYAPWISPPKVGIDNKPGDFEYVKIET